MPIGTILIFNLKAVDFQVLTTTSSHILLMRSNKAQYSAKLDNCFYYHQPGKAGQKCFCLHNKK